MTWALIIKNMGCEKFRFECASGDAAKTRARDFVGERRQPDGSVDGRISFTILDPAGRDWMHCQAVEGKRLKWEWA